MSKNSNFNVDCAVPVRRGHSPADLPCDQSNNKKVTGLGRISSEVPVSPAFKGKPGDLEIACLGRFQKMLKDRFQGGFLQLLQRRRVSDLDEGLDNNVRS